MITNSSAKLDRIRIYPIKSLDGLEISKSHVNRSGGLEFDRMFALFDDKGAYINAKSNPDIIRIRAGFDLDKMELELQFDKNSLKANLDSEQEIINDWFSDFFKKKIHLKRNDEHGFPDDLKRPGPTVYSFESLKLVHQWFPELSIEELRRRFRGNLELSQNSPGFWEDELISFQSFYIGNTEIKASKTCPRCPVPGRDSLNSERNKGFQKKFTEMRKKQSFVKINYEHYYMFGLNTVIPDPKNAIFECGDHLRTDL